MERHRRRIVARRERPRHPFGQRLGVAPRVLRLDEQPDAGQWRIVRRNAGEEMEDALVEMKRRLGQDRAGLGLDHPPVAQRRIGGERIPMRLGQHRQGESEGRPGRSVRSLRGDRLAQPPVELQPGDQQQQLPLERRKPEDAGALDQRRHERGGRGLALIRRAGAGCLDAAGEAADFRDQPLPVELRPSRDFGDRAKAGDVGRHLHGRWIFWVSSKMGTGSFRIIRIESLPSTRSRAR